MNHGSRVDEALSNALRAELVALVQQTATSRTRKKVRLWLAAGAVAGAGLLSGVTAGAAGVFVPHENGQAAPASSAAASYRVEDTLAAFGSISYDYEPFHSPAELAASSQVIVEGVVTGVREGRKGKGHETVVLILQKNSVVKGDLARGNDGNVYLELTGGNSPDPLYFTRAFPKGASVVAYMVPASDGAPTEGTDVTIDNPKAGRPDGQALYLPAAPQGLVLQVGDQDVVWPLVGARAPGKIADTLPGGELIRG